MMRSLSSPIAVSMTIAMSVCARNFWHRLRPPSPGSIRSRMMMSGRFFSIIAHMAPPWVARSTS
ncbi:hypothetical protein D3C80_2176470 [compost metagenome]